MPPTPNYQIPGFGRSAILRLLARWPRPRREKARRDYDLVILKLDHIGDFILATGAIRFAISKTRGRTLLIVSEAAEPIARQLFPDVEVLGLPAFARSLTRDLLPVARQSGRFLRSIRCRTLLHLRYQPGDYHRLIQRWIEAEREIAMEAEGYPAWREGLVLSLESDENLRYPKPTGSYSDEQHRLIASAELEAHRQVCEAWTGAPVSFSKIWPFLDPIINAGATPLTANALLVAPFTTTLIREIRPDQLYEALRLFHKTTPIPILVACAPNERQRAEALVTYLQRCGLREIRLMPEHSLIDYIATVGSARLVFSMDSATAHIAAASGTPGVALLGGGHFGCFAPWSKNDTFTWLSKPLPCFHCEWLCTRAENECLTTIRPAAIADNLLAQFDASRNSSAPTSQPRPRIVPARH